MTMAAHYLGNVQRDDDQLVREHAGLVRKIALHLKVRLPQSVELDDLLQIGMLALLEAAKTYETGHGGSFETYAGIRIRGAIIDQIRRNDWAPRRVRKQMRQAARAIHDIEQSTGRPAREGEVADAIGLEVGEYQQVLAEAASAQILTLTPGEGDDASEIPVQDETASPEALLEDAEQKALLAEAIRRLPERQQLILSLYYEQELNQGEIGEVVGVSHSRVCQLLGDAFVRLRAAMAAICKERQASAA